MPRLRRDRSPLQVQDWQDLASFAVVERIRTVGDHTSTERVFYISSLPADPERIGRAVRSHWEIENRIHWCLDVQFNEDQSRVRSGYAANNLAIVRHIAMNPPDGTVTYEDLFRGPANRDDNVEALAIGPTGAIVLAGDTYVDGKRANIWLQAYDPGPAVAWTRTIGDVGADSSHAVTADADHVYATGCVGNQDLPTDAWVARLVL